MSKNKAPVQDYDLKDFIWEQEDFKFEPKVNRHKKFFRAKKRQLEKEKNANNKKHDYYFFNERERYISKVEQSLLQDYYDMEDEGYSGYRIK